MSNYSYNNNITETNNCLFNLVFRNKFIRSEISRHIKLYKDYYSVKVNSIDQLINHPNKEYITKLYYHSNDQLYSGVIPNSVTSIKFSFKFNQIIKVGDLNSNIKILKFKCKDLLSTPSIGFNQSITPPLNSNGRVIPDSVTTLYLESFNKQLNKNDLPNSLTKLYIPNYNQELNKYILPHSNLKVLDFGYRFDKVLLPNSIPNSVTQLSLGDSFNNSLSINMLPSNLKILSLGYDFNKPIHDGDIPKSLTKLYISADYNFKLSHSIKSITEFY